MARATNYLALMAMIAANIFVVGLVRMLTSRVQMAFADMPPLQGQPLPGLTALILQVSNATNPVVFGILFAVVIGGVLLFAERRETVRRHFAFLVSLGWGLAVLYLCLTLVGLALPLMIVADRAQ